MDALLLIVLVAIGLVVLPAVAQALLEYGRVAAGYVRYGMDSMQESVRMNADSAADRLYSKARRREFLKWWDRRSGGNGRAGAVDGEVLAAWRETPEIRRFVEEEVPAAIRCCVTMHRLTAIAARAAYVYEVASEPECLALRARVVDVLDATVNAIEAYPLLLDDRALLQNLILLRKRVLPTCQACPYLWYAVGQSSELCPSAHMVGITSDDHELRKT